MPIPDGQRMAELRRKMLTPISPKNGEFAIVHNGIISNYQKLRERLIGEGLEFRSTTDTEVFVNLVEEAFAQKNDV